MYQRNHHHDPQTIPVAQGEEEMPATQRMKTYSHRGPFGSLGGEGTAPHSGITELCPASVRPRPGALARDQVTEADRH